MAVVGSIVVVNCIHLSLVSVGLPYHVIDFQSLRLRTLQAPTLKLLLTLAFLEYATRYCGIHPHSLFHESRSEP